MKNLDATFSAANYRHIWDEHARRGRPLTSLVPAVSTIGNEIQRARLTHKKKLAEVPSGARALVRTRLQGEVEVLLQRRREILSTALETYAIEAAVRIRDGRYGLGLNPLPPRDGKTVYRLDALSSPSSYFLVKQIERNIREAFDVSMPNRHRMVSQIVTLLRNKSPKAVLRLDVASYYESISHDALRKMLQEQPRLGQTTQHFLEKLISDYGDLTGETRGLPRGVGISSFLAEAFLKGVDREIRLLPGVTYYARYVDDIVIVITDVDYEQRAMQTRDRLSEALRFRGLARNRAKERLLSSSDASTRRVTLLGYEIAACIPQGTALLDISLTRYNLYLDRISTAFEWYSRAPGVGAATALDKRIALLTSNQRLWRPGGFNSNGVRFSHRAMNEPSKRLEKLDQHLDTLIADLPDESLRARLIRYSFVEGFRSTKFMQLSQRRRDQLTSIWWQK